jgi:hypothetical protein
VLKPPGVAVPIHINPKTGFIAVDAVIDGKRYAMPIDNGSAYTWIRQSDDPSGTVLLFFTQRRRSVAARESRLYKLHLR